MVRRLLLTALLATLAVAMPATAQEDAPFAVADGSAPAGCLSDLSCGFDELAIACEAWDPDCPLDDGQDASGGLLQLGPGCRPWDLNMPDSNQSLAETLILDPEGCIQSFLRRTLGWPPTEAAEVGDLSELPASEPPVIGPVLSWS